VIDCVSRVLGASRAHRYCPWFLLIGGASGTVAKTIFAYDKEVSDDLYGVGSRYVSKQRLEAMLDNEWTQLLTQLSETRGQQTRFFCFVDTVSAP
jgi:hypothetical protein